MEKEKKQLPEGISPAGYGKVTLAFLIDVILMIGLMVGFYYAIGSPLILGNNGLQTVIDERVAYIESTELMERKGDNFVFYQYQAKENEQYGYVKYIGLVHRYFYDVVQGNENFQVNAASSLPSGRTVTKYEGNDAQAYGKWVYENFYRTDFSSIGESMFVPPFMDDGVTYDYTQKPILGAKYTAEGNAEELNAAFLKENNGSYSGIYVDTVIGHFSAQPKLIAYESKIVDLQWQGFLPSFLASPLIVLFIVPAFSKKGKTVGKHILRLSLVGKDGFQAKRWRLFLHYGILTLMFMILALPYQNIARFGLVALLMADFSVFMLGRSNQSLHDMISGTLHIDDTKSPFFANEEAYIAAQKELEPIEATVEEGEDE